MNTEQPGDALAYSATNPEGIEPDAEIICPIPWYMQSPQDPLPSIAKMKPSHKSDILPIDRFYNCQK
jgi:hypothetical protein